MTARILAWFGWLVRQPAVHLIALIVAMTLISSRLPEAWTLRIRIFNGFTIMGVLIWGFFRYGRESRIYRAELHEHFERVEQMLARRDERIQMIEQSASDLAQETSRIVTLLVTETKQNLATVTQQIASGTEAAQKAYEEANCVNSKIEAINQRLLEKQVNEAEPPKP